MFKMHNIHLINFKSILLFISHLLLINCSIRPKVKSITFQFGYDIFSTLMMEIGDPPQQYYTNFHFATPGIFIIDSECGHKKYQCKKYCNDGKFLGLFVKSIFTLGTFYALN